MATTNGLFIPRRTTTFPLASTDSTARSSRYSGSVAMTELERLLVLGPELRRDLEPLTRQVLHHLGRSGGVNPSASSLDKISDMSPALAETSSATNPRQGQPRVSGASPREQPGLHQ